MAKKRNIIVGQSGGPTSVINSSLAGVYKNAIERGFDKVYGMLHGVQGLLDEQYVDRSWQTAASPQKSLQMISISENRKNDRRKRITGG